jgi:hypothetical protein
VNFEIASAGVGGGKRGTNFAQNQRPVSPILTFNKLVRPVITISAQNQNTRIQLIAYALQRTGHSPQGHPLPQTRHQKRVRDSQKSQILTKRDFLRVEEHDWLISKGAERAVDACYDI